jgi:hypothetical protein
MDLVEAIQSADRALGPRLLFRLFKAATQFEDFKKRITTELVILLAGRLTFRVKTIQHIREAWINWARGEIIVPKLDACDCYRCWLESYRWWLRLGIRRIKDRPESEQPNWFPEDVTLEKLDTEQQKKVIEEAELKPTELTEHLSSCKFDPKTPSGGRVVPFGMSPRITALLLTFFREFDCITQSQKTLGRWVTEAAENADGLNPDAVAIHWLRADGLTFFIRLTGDHIQASETGGQSDWQSINRYRSTFDRINTEQVYYAAGRGNWAPPVVPERPGERFPLALGVNLIGKEWKDYNPKRDGTPIVREYRHEQTKEEPVELFHPRADMHDTKPDNRAGFPSEDELSYSRDEHELPGGATEDYEFANGIPKERITTIPEFADPHEIPRYAGDDTPQQRLDDY